MRGQAAVSCFSATAAYLASDFCDMTKNGLSLLTAIRNLAFISQPIGIALLQNATKGQHKSSRRKKTEDKGGYG